jgi:hypothetical protein
MLFLIAPLVAAQYYPAANAYKNAYKNTPTPADVTPTPTPAPATPEYPQAPPVTKSKPEAKAKANYGYRQKPAAQPPKSTYQQPITESNPVATPNGSAAGYTPTPAVTPNGTPVIENKPKLSTPTVNTGYNKPSPSDVLPDGYDTTSTDVLGVDVAAETSSEYGTIVSSAETVGLGFLSFLALLM